MRMRLLYSIYMVLSSLLFLFLLPFFFVYVCATGRYRHHLKERLGCVPRRAVERLKGSPRIWIHAVSLGEVKVAGSIIEALRRIMPGCSVMLSTMTEHGRNLAVELFGKEIPVVYAPVDFVGCVCKSLSRVRPDVLAFLETEIWPAWVFEARRLGIRTCLINGRISVRSIDAYLRLRPFFEGVLKNFDCFSMILEEDAARIQAMGAPHQKIETNGNAKYDTFAAAPDPETRTEMQKVLDLDDSHRVIVAGSTRQGEEEIILDAYSRVLETFPETILIIVPRHIERTRDIGAMIQRRGLKYQVKTDIDEGKARRTENIVIINTFGELFKIYSIGTIVFCGASLVPLGGQNPLEPAVWGKVVLYGPSMEDFLDAKDLLESVGGSVPVSDPQELEERLVWLLGHPEESKAYGERARQAVLNNRGAAEKHARVIERLVSEKKA
ncbi:MAG: 3-deoxy-D-manno-octulosonic acid transferase [Deltaproteobacteria bacterium]|nr:3-deoxy-D-manno-octulosonic acid transferase [Deltaproteobacteria bacterium]